MYRFEEALRQDGYRIIAGTDEAGRGPLAGPVVAAACIIPSSARLEGIKDSKMLDSETRQELFWTIVRQAIVGVGIVSEQEIDQIYRDFPWLRSMLIALTVSLLAGNSWLILRLWQRLKAKPIADWE